MTAELRTFAVKDNTIVAVVCLPFNAPHFLESFSPIYAP